MLQNEQFMFMLQSEDTSKFNYCVFEGYSPLMN